MENRQRRKSLSDRFIIWLLGVLKGCFIGRFFTSYDKANERFERMTGGNGYRGERRLAKFVEKNRIVNFVPKIIQYLMRISLRDYGIMMLLTGLVVTVLYPINDMILFINVTFDMFVLGSAVVLCSVPLLFSSRSLAKNVLSSKIFCHILFDYLGMDKEGFRVASEENEVNFTGFAFVIGAGLGVGSYFILPTTTLLIILLAVLAYCTLRTPEVGAVITIFSIPFVRIEILCAFLTYTFICYIIKVLLRKRIFKLEYMDLWVGITVAVFLFCGLNYRDPLSSFRDVAMNFIIMLSFFLFANMIYSKEWFRRSIVSFTSSSLIVAVIAIFQKIYIELCESFEILADAIPLENQEVTSTLGDSTVLALFMVIAIPFALVHMLSERTDVTKFGGFVMAAVLLTALVLAGSPVGYVGLLVGVLLVFAFYSPKNVYFILIVAIALPTLYFIVPSDMKAIIASAGPLKGISIRGSLVGFKNNFLTALKNPWGIGISGKTVEDVFGKEYVDSLPVQLIANYGIIAFFALVIMLVMFARVILTYSVKAKNEYRRINGCAGLCTIVGLLAVGTFSYVWLDKRIFLVFMMIMALSFSYIKVEREGEVVLSKYVDFSSATMEIKLKDVYVYEPETRSRYVRVPKVKKKHQRPELNQETKIKEFPITEEPTVEEKAEEVTVEQKE